MFELHPLVILAIGIAIVLGAIILLRANAFLALIAAAIAVSLLAPDDAGPSERISRVATAFGAGAAGIGIVIALAAIIGKCMMDSGAADRIVQAFLGVLGEKRAATALMGSGFVLAVPVFFDTVFYLLVPLARSLHRRTARDYVKYVLAIAAGGAITHTLVPPTPGPLLMAANLRIELGTMILIGALVAIVPAFAGVFFATWANRTFHIPVRPVGITSDEAVAHLPEEDRPEAHAGEEPTGSLPPLWLALLPVLLPVVLISTNTVTETLANEEGTPLVRPADLNVPALADAVHAAADLDDASPAVRLEQGPALRLREVLPADVVERLDAVAEGGAASDELVDDVAAALNEHVVRNAGFYDRDAFRLLELPPAAAELLKTGPANLRPVPLTRFGRLLLETAFPDAVAEHTWETPLRRAADWTGSFGSPVIALFLSTAIAMATLYRQRGLTLDQIGAVVEESLMSGGVIILITSAGSAFGAMLKTAQIGDTIKQMVESDGSGATMSGMAVLLLGFGVAGVLKVAQGSSTVAMITVSGMFLGFDAATLGFHPVYLATAIGSGSLMGSWMNDSGFWIFAKMSGFTEREALKTWTVLLLVLGTLGLGMTVLLATLMPLT